MRIAEAKAPGAPLGHVTHPGFGDRFRFRDAPKTEAELEGPNAAHQQLPPLMNQPGCVTAAVPFIIHQRVPTTHTHTHTPAPTHTSQALVLRPAN